MSVANAAAALLCITNLMATVGASPLDPDSTVQRREEHAEDHATTTSGANPEAVNEDLSNYLYWTLACIAGALIIWRISTVFIKYIRHVSCLNNDTQRYFAAESGKLAWLKKNVLYAPIFSKRHNREFTLSSAVNVGTLPTRMQLVFLVGYFATNVAFCVMDIPFTGSRPEALKMLRNRSGVLATVNMIPLVLMAARNNPLIRLLGVPFDTFNLIHRWFGRIVMLEALTHTFAFLVNFADKAGWEMAIKTTTSKPFLLYGFIATIAFVAISIQAMGPLRHAFYEIFKLAHIALAILAIVGLWYHLKDLPELKYLWPVVLIWPLDRLSRILRVAYYQLGPNGTEALVEALPGNACRITVTMARPWDFCPGQHAYLYMPSISYWQSHPFSVAWSEDADDLNSEKLPMNRRDVLAKRKTTMSFVVRARTGFTRSLYKKAADSSDGRMLTRCFVEGPYGDMHQMGSYGTVMLFAGGVGITQMVPHVRDLVREFGNGTVVTRKVVLVWVVQSPEHLEWIRPWMTEVLSLDRRREVLRVLLFISRPRSTKEIHSPSSTVQMFPGRPNITTLIGNEMEDQVGTMGVSVCGPGNFSDEVRRAVRNKQYQGAIDFFEEAFTW